MHISFITKHNTKGYIACGFLATLFTLPFIAGKGVSADDRNAPSPSKPASRLITESDRSLIEKLRENTDTLDSETHEVKWAQTVWTTTREKLAQLYSQEKKENEAIKKGELNEKDREVKICRVEFIPPGEIGHDEAVGPAFLIVKKYKGTRVNEQWGINMETGGILPTKVFRVRTKVFDGSLDKPGAEDLFITDMLKAKWGADIDGSRQGAPLMPFFYRQKLFDRNELVQARPLVSSPSICMHCHNSGINLTTEIFGVERTDFGSITPSVAFDWPPERQPGYIGYMRFSQERVKRGQTDQKEVERVAKVLKGSTSFENPLIVETLLLPESNEIPWVGADTLRESYEPTGEGISYKEGGKTWIEAGYKFHRGKLFEWWNGGQEIIPVSITSNRR